MLINQNAANKDSLFLRSPHKAYFTLDSTFPERLDYRSNTIITVELIHALFENYSKRHLTKATDRAIAISGLHDRIEGALKCQSRYGIFELYLHKNLLWQASGSKMERIPYPEGEVPSWSWMAYTGGVRFMKTLDFHVRWYDSLRFDTERKLALIANVGYFRNCTAEPDGTGHIIFDFRKVRRGWLQYNVEGIVDLRMLRCVCVGKDRGYPFSTKKYYILVVRSTSIDGEYERVGSGVIQENYVEGEVLNMRIV